MEVAPSKGNTAFKFPGACEGGGIPDEDGLIFDDNGQTTRLSWLKDEGKGSTGMREGNAH